MDFRPRRTVLAVTGKFEVHGWRQQGALAALLYLPLVLSYNFILGNVNFYTGLGLAFLTLAHFLWLRRQTRPRPK